MGLLSVSPEKLAAQAQAAARSGRSRFVLGLANVSGGTGQVDDWAQKIEAVENAGWRVDHFATSAGEAHFMQAHVLFRRA